MFLDLLSSFWIISSITIFLNHILLSQDTSFRLFDSCLNFLKVHFVFGKLKRGDDVTRTKYGKAGSDPGEHVLSTQIPKSWFCHFYASGAVTHSVVFGVFICSLLGYPMPHFLKVLIQWINLDSGHKGLGNNVWPVLIVFSMEFMQLMRRLYECLFVSIFSKGTMSIVHYFYGVFLYSSFGLGLLASVDVEKLDFICPTAMEFGCYLLGIFIFLWSSYFQQKTMVTFAELRQGGKGKRSEGHYIPYGHLFEWVSCPHYLCEILIYMAMCLIFQFMNIYLLSVALFVWANQVSVSIFVHKWYQKNLPDYPVTRKAVFPCIL